MSSSGPKSVVITGGNSGLGAATARILASRPEWQVILACRDKARAEPVRARLQDNAEHAVLALDLDLASLDSIRAFPGILADSNAAPLGALVCNAGVQFVAGGALTADGFEATFGVNHLGHFLLTRLLLPRLTENALVIIVASDTHDPSTKTGMPAPQLAPVADLAHGLGVEGSEGFIGRTRYTTSKLCNVHFTYELARRLARARSPRLRSSRALAFDPGMMPGTGLARDYGPLVRAAWKFVLPIATLFRSNVHAVDTSAGHLARLLWEPRERWPNRTYVSGGRPAQSSVASHAEPDALALWNESSALVGLSEDIELELVQTSSVEVA